MTKIKIIHGLKRLKTYRKASELFGLAASASVSVATAIAVSMAVVAVVVGPVRAEDLQIVITVLNHTNETDANLERVKEALQAIPVPIRKEIAAAKIGVTLTPRLIYDMPERSGQKVFRNGRTSDNVGGEFESGRLRVLIPEQVSWGNSAIRPQGDYVISVARHELGHAWDFARGFSKSEAFLAAYDQDFARLSNEQLRKFQYDVTGTAVTDANVPTKSGHAECFACVFNMLCEPSQKQRLEPNGLAQAFPQVVAWMQSEEPGLKKDPVRVERSQTQAAAQTPHVSEENIANSKNQMEVGSKLLGQKQYGQALTALSQAINLDPNNDRAYLLRANAYSWLGRYNLAVHDYTVFIRRNDDNAEAHQLRASAYGWLGQRLAQERDNTRAKILLKQALPKQP